MPWRHSGDEGERKKKAGCWWGRPARRIFSKSHASLVISEGTADADKQIRRGQAGSSSRHHLLKETWGSSGRVRGRMRKNREATVAVPFRGGRRIRLAARALPLVAQSAGENCCIYRRAQEKGGGEETSTYTVPGRIRRPAAPQSEKTGGGRIWSAGSVGPTRTGDAGQAARTP